MDRQSPTTRSLLQPHEQQDAPAVALVVAEEAPLHEEVALHGRAADYHDGYHDGEEEAAGGCDEDYMAAEDLCAAEDYPRAGAADTGGGARPADGVHCEEVEVGLLKGMPRPGRPQRPRRKGDKKPFLKRSWLCITPGGETSVLQADKYKLTAQLGIQTRDLRLLDPNMATTYPSAILCRDKSIVVNLEHIKVIITTDRALVVNHEDEGNAKFVEELKQRIAHPTMAASKSFPSTNDLQRMQAALHAAPGHHKPTAAAAGVGGGGGGGNGGGGPMKGMPLPGVSLGMGMGVQLPFELRVLEICLDELASEYDLQATELEAAAYPALDTLAAKVTSPHLERVRRLKNRLVRLTTRVETVREVLEKFLDDDEDMHDLNLTANKEREREAAISEEEDGPAGISDDGRPPLSYMGRRVSGRSSASSASTSSSVMESEVAEVEMLLEAYFMHFDNTFNRLTTLNEYIKDTEDLVNIKLDQHRNQLITTDLILTAFTGSMALVTTIAGIFGMNLDSGLAEEPGVFNQVTIASCVGALALFVVFVIWAWRYGLLVFD